MVKVNSAASIVVVVEGCQKGKGERIWGKVSSRRSSWDAEKSEETGVRLLI